MKNRLGLVVLNILGGSAVLGSYAWGILGYPELHDAFWGGVPQSLRELYTLNMFLAAAGYLAAFLFFMWHGDDQIKKLFLPYTLILIPSALWLPLTVWVLQAPAKWLWLTIRVDLLLVGLGGLLLFSAVRRTTDANRLPRLLTCLGLAFFVLQTAVLDALVWPYYFELPVR